MTQVNHRVWFQGFMPGTYLEKRAYVRQIIDHYEAVEKRFLVAETDSSKAGAQEAG